LLIDEQSALRQIGANALVRRLASAAGRSPLTVDGRRRKERSCTHRRVNTVVHPKTGQRVEGAVRVACAHVHVMTAHHTCHRVAQLCVAPGTRWLCSSSSHRGEICVSVAASASSRAACVCPRRIDVRRRHRTTAQRTECLTGQLLLAQRAHHEVSLLRRKKMEPATVGGGH